MSVFDDGTAAKLSAHLDLSEREKVFLFSWKQQAQLVLSMMYLTVSKSKVTILALPGEMKLCEKVQVSDFSLQMAKLAFFSHILLRTQMIDID